MPRSIDLDAFDLAARHVDDAMSEDLRRKVRKGELDLAAALKKLNKERK